MNELQKDKEELTIKLENIKKLNRFSILAAISLILLAVFLIIFSVYLIIYAIALNNSTEPVSFDNNMLFILIPIGILLVIFVVFYILHLKYKKLINSQE